MFLNIESIQKKFTRSLQKDNDETVRTKDQRKC